MDYPTEKIRIGFHYHTPAREDKGILLFHGPIGVFIDGLAEHCEEITCFLHSPNLEETPPLDFPIQSPNVRLVDLGARGSILQRHLHIHRYTTVLRNHISDLDILLIRGPSPLLPGMVHAAKGIPVALLIVGDYLESAMFEYDQPGWRRALIKMWAYRYQQQQLQAARRSLVFVNTHKLFHQLEYQIPHLIETRTTTLHAGDFFERTDTCQGTPIRLLFTGRIEYQKGLFFILEALEHLVNNGFDVILDLAGWSPSNDTFIKQLQNSIAVKGLQERVIYHGFLPLGEPLFNLYRQADIYIIGSLSSFEGFPRTIWEAMAHSLPVVATRVGSIPDYISGAAELIEPGSAVALSEAVQRLLDNPYLRREYIRQGMKLARENTIETRSAEMAAELQKWVARCLNL